MITTSLATIFSGIFSLNKEPNLLQFKQTVDQFFNANFKEIIHQENISFDFTMMKVDKEKMKIEVLSNNKHLAIYKNSKWEQIELESIEEYKAANLDFQSGEQFAIWTDGLKDFYIEDNKKLGNKGILNFLEDYAGLNASKLNEHFNKFIEENKEKHAQLDDILFFIAQF